MTYAMSSDVPMIYVKDYQSADHLTYLLRQPAQPKLTAPLAAAFISSVHNLSGREQ
jgi:hypothetical protein